jgi:hypothetical protein
MFQDNPDYTELDFRNKRTMQRFLPGSELGIQHGSMVTPPGFLLGQKIKHQLADAAERQCLGGHAGRRRHLHPTQAGRHLVE